MEEFGENLSHLTYLNRYGVRLIGTWQHKPLPEKLIDLSRSNIDFIALSYEDIIAWVKKWPRRQGLDALKRILELPSQIIVTDVPHEQDLYQNLPLSFDFAAGPAFGVPKPFSQIQV